MIEKNNEIIIQRGESFTIDKSVRNRDGSPYIVSSQYDNPYILITVASNRHDYEYNAINWWLDLSTLPKFLNTQPKKITSFDYTNTIGEEPYEYLYYVDDITKCKYFDYDDIWHDYDFRIVHTFLHSITKNWVGQNYVYSIRLVSGSDMDTYLRGLYKSIFGKDAPLNKNKYELYEDIKNTNENHVNGLVIDRPIATIDVVRDILLPTKLTVMSDLNGGLK